MINRMNKQKYIAPRAELIVVKAQVMQQFSGFYNDGEHQGDVTDDDDSPLGWGESD